MLERPTLARLSVATMIAMTTACAVDDAAQLGGQALDESGCKSRNGEVALHWATGGRCIPVTYNPALEEHVDVITKALEAWSKVECTELCFEAPVPADLDPSAVPPGVLHFGVGSTTPQLTKVVTVWSSDTQQAQSSVVDLHTDWLGYSEPGYSVGVVTGAVGRALGLGDAPSEVASTLNPNLANVATEPTDYDVEALCQRYGPGGVCEF